MPAFAHLILRPVKVREVNRLHHIIDPDHSVVGVGSDPGKYKGRVGTSRAHLGIAEDLTLDLIANQQKVSRVEGALNGFRHADFGGGGNTTDGALSRTRSCG